MNWRGWSGLPRVLTVAAALTTSISMLTLQTGAQESAAAPQAPQKMELADVRHWAYNIQDVHTDRQYDQLLDSHYDMYVLELVVTEKGMEDYDIAGLVYDIRQRNIAIRGVDPIILAYVDVAQAEDWRWYWRRSWGIGEPPWIVGDDPNDWEGNFPVVYWHPTWEDIVIYGHRGRSHVQETLDAGFDGIYMDWVEAFSDDSVIDRVMEDLDLGRNAAERRAAQWMFRFIERIRDYAREADPDYLVVAQNASDLHGYDPERYEAVIDAIALEAIWWDGVNGDGDGDGVGSFDDWDDPKGYNVRTDRLYPGWTQEVLGHLESMAGRLPVFCAEYAQDRGGKDRASQVYEELAPGVCVPYATRRALARLSKTPLPAGYGPLPVTAATDPEPLGPDHEEVALGLERSPGIEEASPGDG